MVNSALRTFNKSPYFDDFDASKNFQRILFRPSYSVQTRELNQLQTILQDQISVISDYIVTDKSSVVGAKASYNKKIAYIQLASNFQLSNNIDNYIDASFVSSDGIEGNILFAQNIENSDPATLYVKYNTSAPESGATVPKQNDTLIITFKDGSKEFVKTGLNTNWTGFGTAVTISEGIFYIKKTFVRIPEQALVLSKYNEEDIDLKNYTIGLKIVENVITPESDNSLYDNALGSPNESAPGAHRYQILGLLANKADIPLPELQNFVTVITIEKDEIAVKPKEENSILPSILAILARRTYDESGDYVVDTFDMDVREHLKDENNNGVYTLENGGREDYLCLQFDTGIAYVRGWEVRINGTTKLDYPKARETGTIDSTNIQTIYSNSIVVTPTAGDVTLGEKLNFKDASNNIIGSANVIGIEPSSTNIKLFITNVKFISQNGFGQVSKVISSGNSTNLVAFSSNFVSSDINNYNSTLVYPLPFGFSQTVIPTTFTTYKTYVVNSVGSNITLNNENSNEQFSPYINDYYVYVENVGSGVPSGNVSFNNSANKTSVTLSVSGLYSGTQSKRVKVIAKVYSKPTIKIKTLNDYTDTVNASQILQGETELSYADGFKLLSVINQNNLDVTSKFEFHTGANDAYYGKAKIRLKSGQSIGQSDIFSIKYQYFSHSTSGDFFSVDSYKNINYMDIPTYQTSSGQNIFLGGAVDFRTTIDNSNNILQPNASGFPGLNSLMNSKVVYYLARYDRVMVTSAGNLVLVKGEAAFNPKLPSELKDAITLYTLYAQPYTFGINSVVSTKINHKRYTMSDIGKLDARLTNVEEVTLLNKLESDTASINFYDKFKSGYIVDNFSTSVTGDISDSLYGVATDLKDPLIRPKDIAEFHSLDIVESQSNGIRYHRDSGYITLDYEEVPFISQDLGSSIVKIQPLLTYSYGTGTIALNPSEDVWKEEYKYTNNIYTSSTNVLDPIITRTEINVDFGMNSNNRTPNGW